MPVLLDAALLTELLCTASDAILLVNARFEIEIFNDRAEDIFGHKSQEVLGRPLSILLPPSVREVHEEHMERFGREKETRRLMGNREQLEGLRSDGSLFPVEVSISKLSFEGEWLYMAIVRDITEQQRAQQALKEARDALKLRVAERTQELNATQEELIQTSKFNAIGELAANIAHEMNNPLGIISAKARLLLSHERDNMSAKVERELTKITAQCDRLSRLTRGLLDYARPSFGVKSEVEVQAVLGHTRQLMEHRLQERSIQVHVDDDAGPAVVWGNRGELEQIFSNLFTNAIEAMAEGGEIHIATLQEGGEWVLRFRDTGEGISPEHLPRIFEPFFTTKGDQKGTGLGLSIAFGLVRSHKGALSADSREGAGTTFEVRLPLYSPEEDLHETLPDPDRR